jgi:hypothetical protein
LDTINLYGAKTKLSQLVERAAAGEFGFMAGRVRMSPDFDEALPDELMEAFAGHAP